MPCQHEKSLSTLVNFQLMQLCIENGTPSCADPQQTPFVFEIVLNASTKNKLEK